MISDFDAEELIRGMYGLSDDVGVIDYVDEKLEFEWDCFVRLLNELVPLITVAESPLTGTVYKGFAKDGMFLIKVPVDA